MILAIALFETPRSRTRRISSSTGALGDEITLDLGKQREERGHDVGVDVVLALDADVDRHEGDARVGERIKDGDDLAQQSAEPGRLSKHALATR